MKYAAFGTHHPNVKLSTQYSFKIITHNDTLLNLNAIEIPVICPPMRRSHVSSSLLSDLHPLADSYGSDRDTQIDLLIGLDNYWHILTGPVKHLQPGLVAQQSLFGWILSGSDTTSSQLLSFQQP